MKEIFKELSKNKTSLVESKISEEWENIDILNKTIKNRENNESFVFYDGPATANAMPGLHHMLSKLLKDTFCKYKTMQGYKVIRKAGWDTHGLPVELEVEKALGFKSKTDIEEYGIDLFNEKCKESVFKNEKAFTKFTKKMGQFIDIENAYVTYDNDYIETEWWILKEMFDAGLIYEGHKILPFCSRCGTGLASHEVAQGYKEITSNSVIVTMKLKKEDAYFLVWTTTPWTLLANVAVCVNPKEKYIKVESKGHKFIIAKKLAKEVLGSEYKVIEEYMGAELENIEYEQLLPFINPKKKAFYVTCADFVTMEEGTGIVHIAPAFGADDYEVARKYDLPVLNPVSEEAKYTEGPWKEKVVFNVDLEIIDYLKENNKLFIKQKIKHNYPHCWRCDTPLLYYAKPSWYIEVTKYKDLMIKENNKVNWIPDFIGEKRFGNWLENLNDWAISRSRYWGTPLNIWRCDCGNIESIGSREELINRAIEKIDMSIELHKPYVDDIHIKCLKCNKVMNRVPEVMDVWFDSGCMPFAQYHYPFENKELFESQFPADFICEGIDQTRGWFYVLMAVSTFVIKKAPYKNVLVNDMVQDKFGKKMSKSKGNGLDPFELIEEYGADTLRWYFLYVSPVWTPTRFDINGLKEVYSKFFNTLRNTYNFFALYANTDKLDISMFNKNHESKVEIDKWILSKYNRLIKDCTKHYDEYDLTKVTKVITSFVNEDLSNWYIRRNRKRFWASAGGSDKKDVYVTTYNILLGLSKLIAPIVPFISEEIYKNLTNNTSVHLADFPKVDENQINDNLEQKMDLVRNVISLGRNVREEVQIKVRQPLSEALLDIKNKTIIDDLESLIMEELNVKKITYIEELNKYMNYEVKPNFKSAGPLFGANVKDFANELKNLSYSDITNLEDNKEINVLVKGKEYIVNKDLVDIRVSSKEGYDMSLDNELFIILNTTLDEELLNEGISRELISNVQQIRKMIDLDITDRINIIYKENNNFKKAITNYINVIKKETLCDNIVEKDNDGQTIKLNNLEIKVLIEKVK